MPNMNRRSFVVGTGLATAALYTPARAAEDQSAGRGGDIDSLIAAERDRITEAMEREDLPGVAIAFIHDNQPVWTEGFGVTDQRTKRKVELDTIFSIQSTSKNFTATAVMLAVQRGLLDLDAPITKYVPDFTVRSRFEDRPHEKTTLRLLLANRAGFTHEAPIGNNYDPEFPTFAEHVRSISQTWLRFPVGERYRYSNLGFDLAGFILQECMGKPFAQCVRELIFEPLGMKDSTVATDQYAKRTNRAVGHQRGYDSVPLKTPLIASGGVYTSARDVAKYCAFHVNRGRADGKAILDEKLWNEMHAFAYGGDYSLGVIRSELRYGETNVRMLSHAGGGFGFGCVFQYCPSAGMAWVAMFNKQTASSYGFGKPLLDAALTRRFGAAAPRIPAGDLPCIDLPPAWLQKYTGRYVGRNVMATLAIEDGTLVLRTSKTTSPVRFTAPDELAIASPQGDAITYRYEAASELAPAHLECWVGEQSLDYNDSERDAPGPDKTEWAPYLGRYRLVQWGKPADEIVIQRRNGYLYMNETRLIVEHEPGLFFTCDGEAVDFRQKPATWRNFRMERV